MHESPRGTTNSWERHNASSDSGSRILRGAERFRTPVAGTKAVGVTSRIRRSVGGASSEYALPNTVQPIQTVCAHCGQTYVVALRADMGQVPCIHCGKLNQIHTA